MMPKTFLPSGTVPHSLVESHFIWGEFSAFSTAYTAPITSQHFFLLH